MWCRAETNGKTLFCADEIGNIYYGPVSPLVPRGTVALDRSVA